MCAAGFFLVTEEQCDAPQTGQTNQAEDHSTEQRGLSTEQEGHQIKAEQTDAAPAQFYPKA